VVAMKFEVKTTDLVDIIEGDRVTADGITVAIWKDDVPVALFPLQHLAYVKPA
jgi:hypothetical protein